MPQPWSPSAEKLEKKAVFLPYCGDEESDADYGPHHGYFHHTAEMKQPHLMNGLYLVGVSGKKTPPLCDGMVLGKVFSGERGCLGWMTEYGERLVNSSCAVDKDSRFGAL